jgi:prepilin-type processing-associated H-X9-DG protein
LGFTFAELLLVIGLIVLLIGILLPTIAGARRQANLLKCASNLRQITAACMLHANDKKGYLPLSGAVVADYLPAPVLSTESDGTVETLPITLNDRYRQRYTYGGGNDSQFFLVPVPAAVAHYFGINDLPFDDVYQLDLALNDNRGAWKMFMCPDTDALTKSRVTPDPANNTPEGQGVMMAVTYRTWNYYSWSTNTDYAFNEGLTGYHFDRRYASRRLAGRLAAARRPSEMVLVSDAKRRPMPAFGWSADGWICWTPELSTTGRVSLADAWIANGRASDRSGFDVKRHRGRMNVAFADGHVDLLRINERDLQRACLLTE